MVAQEWRNDYFGGKRCRYRYGVGGCNADLILVDTEGNEERGGDVV